MTEQVTKRMTGVKQLKESEELLLIAYHDGECNFVNAFLARRLLKRSPQASEFILNLKNMGGALRSSRAGANPSVDLWDRISARIEAEERAEVMLGERAFRKQGKIASAFAQRGEWWNRLTWGASGAAFAAVCSAVLIQGGIIGNSGTRIPALVSAPSRIPLVAPVAFNNSSSAVSPLEMDWMRSEGRLHVMQDPRENSAIIWIKPRTQTAQASFAGDSNQHLSRHYSRSNTHIPVAIPASGPSTSLAAGPSSNLGSGSWGR